MILIQRDLPVRLIVVSFSGCCARDMDMGISFDSRWLLCLHVVVMGLLPWQRIYKSPHSAMKGIANSTAVVLNPDRADMEALLSDGLSR